MHEGLRGHGHRRAREPPWTAGGVRMIARLDAQLYCSAILIERRGDAV
jgi:hypothetical protein